MASLCVPSRPLFASRCRFNSDMRFLQPSRNLQVLPLQHVRESLPPPAPRLSRDPRKSVIPARDLPDGDPHDLISVLISYIVDFLLNLPRGR
jgi:hypothetical protein